MREAEQQFRRVIGHRNLGKLAIAIERDIAAKRAADTLHSTTKTPKPEVPTPAA